MTTDLLPLPKNPIESLLFEPERAKKFMTAFGGEQQGARFLVSAAHEIWLDPKKRECTAESIFSALFDVASLKLYCAHSLGHVYLIPYAKVLTLQLGYRGLIALGSRDPRVQSFTADITHEGDEFEFAEGSNPFVRLVKAPKGRQARARTYGFSIITYVGGGSNIRVLPWDEIEAIRNNSNAWKAGGKAAMFWKNFPDAMGAKTVIRSQAKVLSIGDDFQQGVAIDTQRYGELEHRYAEEPKFLPRPEKEIKTQGGDELPSFLQ